MTYTFVYPTPNTITFNTPFGPNSVELRLTSQMTNTNQVGTVTSILFTLIFANDRYSEYVPTNTTVLQDLSEEFIEGIYNYELVNVANSAILEEGTIKIKNESQDNWPTAYVSTNETREGIVFAPNNL